MKRPEPSDYTNEDGSVDHQKSKLLFGQYRKWQIDTGKICSLCEGFVAPSTYEVGSRLCFDCRDISRPEELIHDSRVRCPHCGANWSVDDGNSYELYSDGDHEVWCDECDTKFIVVTNVSYSFSSPPRENMADTDENIAE